MICKICGKKFKAITNTHLKSHNTTTQEYCKKFNTINLYDKGLKSNYVPWNKNSCKVNHSYFKKESNNMYYILGLWFADGYVTKNRKNKVAGLSLHKKDIELIHKIKNELNLKKNIAIKNDKRYKHSGQASIEIYSEEIFDDLVKFGCVQRKSLTLKIPNIPKHYESDFIRGVFDGDGCITYNRKQMRVVFTSGSFEFLNELNNIIFKNTGITTPTKNKNEKYMCFHLSYHRKGSAKIICDWLYKDSNLFLKRKFDRYYELKEILNE